MSKIGKKPILIPKEIKVNLSEGKIRIIINTIEKFNKKVKQ